MRGLKLPAIPICELPDLVASFTDAWIETSTFEMGNDWTVSHLLQMRGLKLPTLSLTRLQA